MLNAVCCGELGLDVTVTSSTKSFCFDDVTPEHEKSQNKTAKVAL